MIRDLLKWVAPGLVTVLGGTTAALSMATPVMVEGLDREGRSTLEHIGVSWADISVSGREVLVSGTIDQEAEANALVAALEATPGVSDVVNRIAIAPVDTPFRLHVSVEDGAVTLSGSVPNSIMSDELAMLSSVGVAKLAVHAGYPDTTAWRQGVDFALEQATMLEAGEIELSDLTLTMNGRAKSQAALGAVQVALADVPDAITLADAIIRPMLVKPYTWSAAFDGKQIQVSGHIPNDGVAERYRVASLSDVPIATGLSLASGEPKDFAETSTLLLSQLARLENGEASIVDGVSRLSGTPATVEIAQAVTDALSNSGSILALQPPLVSDYWVSITRQAGGTLVFDGFVPNDATRQGFSEVEGADVNFLRLGGGAPANYQAGTTFALEVLSHVSEGRAALSGGELTVRGIAASPSDYDAVNAMLTNRLPQGVVLARAEVRPQRADRYRFAIVRQADGHVVLNGMLPSRDLEAQLRTEAGSLTTSNVTYASGEPINFATAVTQAAAFLPWLRNGEIAFDGTGWTVSGTPASRIDQGAIETEFAVEGLAQAGWTLDLASPAAEPQPVAPYVWSAERLADGSFLFAGNVPAQSVKDYLAVHTGTRGADTTTIAPGAPDDFAAQARAAVDALLLLDEGRATFDGSAWSFAGTAADETARQQSLAAVSAALSIDAEAQVFAPAQEPYIWSASKPSTGAVRFAGNVPAASLQRFLAVRGGDAVTDATVIRDDAPDGFSNDVLRGLDVLSLLSEGEVAFDGTNWSVNGVAATPQSDAEIAAVLGDGTAWAVKVANAPAPAAEPTTTAEVTTPTEPEVTQPTEEVHPAPVATAPTTSPEDMALCSARLAELSAHNAILFQSGAAIIASSATTELDAFAAALAMCPQSSVFVEGHTDSDGDDQKNLALSVARAEAVVNALIERGVAADRLYAVGYGETQPIADNATADGKRQNRRIVISVRDGEL